MRRRRAGRIGVALAILVAGSAYAVPPPPELQDRLEQCVRERALALLEGSERDGVPQTRGVWSRAFRPVPGGGWQTVFHRDRAEPGHLETERLRLTLREGEDGWTIVDETVEDTYDRLVRSLPGDEEFHRFASFYLAREGLTVTAWNGSVWVDFLDGRPHGIVVSGERTAFHYEPPTHAGSAVSLYRVLLAEHPGDFAFDPEIVRIECSPAECDAILANAFEGLLPVEPEEADPSLRRVYENDLEERRRELRDDPFSGFRLPFEPDNRYLAIALKRASVLDHWLQLRADDRAGWEVLVGVSRWGWLFGYAAEATIRAGATPYAIERRDDRGARGYHVRQIRGEVDLAVRDSATMSGDVTFVLQAKRDLEEVPFSLARLRPRGGAERQLTDPSLQVDSIRDGEGRDLTWVKLGSASGLVVLPAPVRAGDSFELRVRFENRDAIYKLTPSYSAVARGGWLPFVRFADVLERFDLRVRVPAKYETLSVGRKTEDTFEGDLRVTRWVCDRPMNFPTVIFGQYVVDGPGIEAVRSDGSKIPVRILVDEWGKNAWNIRGRQLPALAEQAVNALNLYREIFGTDYPYEKLDLVNDPLGFLYGQSPASIVYLGSGAFRGSGILGAAFGAGTTRFHRSLVAHEVAHQWWGGLVTNANSRNYWFIESLSEYASALFLEAVAGADDPERGWKAYLDQVESWRRRVLDSKLWGSVQGAGTLSTGDYQAAVYAKGPFALHILRMEFGLEKVVQFLRQSAIELQGREVVTLDLQNVAERVFGENLDWFFDQWIRGVGVPEFTLDYRTQKTEDGTWLVWGIVRQRVLSGIAGRPLPGVFFRATVPITVKAKRGGQEFTTRVRVEGAETPFLFRVTAAPKRVELNHGQAVLAHDVVQGDQP